ncbi:hypothetical protein BRPE64_ACDS11840 [Caballeronia insecticola]|uniref:Uncharacterized protein n=1 Tax=Caballeronia insecticola TaxID=758793 RepID=R4WGC7_9BURK|nr:hypothetical protein BRPE64_ACDS11840 [Caballeronia insecticola]
MTEQGDMLGIRGGLQASVGQAGHHDFPDTGAHHDDFVAQREQGLEPSSAADDFKAGSGFTNDDLN